MIETITVDSLTEDSVSIKTQKHITENGVDYTVGPPHRKSYVNSEQGRLDIANDLADPQLSAVMAVWGDMPTVITKED